MKRASHSNNTALRNAKILLVEDNDDQWVIIQQAIRQVFCEVTVSRVATIQQAITQLEDWQQQEWEIPKLILLDLYLPTEEEGWQLLKQIKSMSASIRRIPIVMLTSSTAPADIEEAYQLGISSYTVKPIHFEEWLAYLRELRTYWWETATLPPVMYGV